MVGGLARPSLGIVDIEKKKVASVPAVVAVAGCILTVLMHACRPWAVEP